LISFSITAGLSVAGPSVQIIFVLLMILSPLVKIAGYTPAIFINDKVKIHYFLIYFYGEFFV